MSKKKQLDQQEVPGKFHNGRPLPKAEPVREIDRNANDGKGIECARKQNEMSDGQLAQVVAGENVPTRVTPS